MRACALFPSAITLIFPNDDDWLKIQFQFMINEMPLFGVIANAINVSLLPAFLFVLLALMVVMHEMLNKVCAKHG